MRERRKLKTIKEFWCEESGMGTVEIILIIVDSSITKGGCVQCNYISDGVKNNYSIVT